MNEQAQTGSVSPEPQLRILLIVSPGCQVCRALKLAFVRVVQAAFRTEGIIVEAVNWDPDADQSDVLGGITPRAVPTVIAFLDGRAVLGWEGFASMAPHEIQDELVHEALSKAVSLRQTRISSKTHD